MYIVRQDNYDDFKCIAGDCPASCCIGWQILIDPETLEKYRKYPDDFKQRFKAGVDFDEEVFKQKDRRCAMLSPEGLCDIQSNCGEDYLCYTCSTYPRHLEEFEDVRELSLALSCPEVARMAVYRKEKLTFVEEENREIDEDFEEFDYLMYTKLLDARDIIYKIAQNRQLPIYERMQKILDFSRDLQQCIDEERSFDMDEVISSFQMKTRGKYRIDADYSALEGLERLNEAWTQILNEAKLVSFDQVSVAEEVALEQILIMLLYTYFCGAVYDDWIFSKAALCVYSVYWIYMIYKSTSPRESMDKLAEIVYLYTREVEHSDPNLDALEEYFYNNMQ